MPSNPRAPGPGPIPRFTRTEVGVWIVYGIVAVLLIAIPVATRRLSLADIGAGVLLLGAAAMSWGWLHGGQLRTEEWLSEAEYEEFLRDLHRPYEPPEGS